eukprot:TRINITY_DN85361_c0_g1_i1.p2 TRINITY_DN85361_c0_g1~~TRINITY_DN85361_c0_g1_i1.p2  ORF type:complete len:195 (-),score=28.21 TRINITY_DN85361_c0_g1_i1:1260-1844(-)
MPKKNEKEIPITHSVKVILLGLAGSGKTSLVKQLELHNKGLVGNAGAFATTPSMQEISQMETKDGVRVHFKEIGGALVPSWITTLRKEEEKACLLYLIDLSNAPQLGSTLVELYNVLGDQEVPNMPVLVLLTKVDMPSTFSVAAFNNISQLNQIIATNPHLQMKVMHISTFTAENIPEVYAWVLTHKKAIENTD